MNKTSKAPYPLTDTREPNADAVRVDLRSGQPAMSGRLNFQQQGSDMHLHSSEGVELDDLNLTLERPARLTLGLLLHGRLDFSLGDRRYRIEAKEDAPRCFAINLHSPTQWQKFFTKGNHVAKVTLCLEPAWLAHRHANTDQRLARLCQHHASVHSWAASVDSQRIARQLLQNSQQHVPVPQLEMESDCLRFAATTLDDYQKAHAETLPGQQHVPLRPPSAEALALRHRLEEIIASRDAQNAPLLDELAMEFGRSVSTLQRSFKRHFGMTLVDYLRTRRLEIARDQLRHEAISIGEVAWRAGYRHPSNFCTAFRKQFGHSPGEFGSDLQ